MRPRRATLAMLTAAALASMAPTCGAKNAATLYFEPATLTVAAGTWFEVDVVASISGSLQAFDLDAFATPASLTPSAALPHADFDDGGGLLVAPQIDAAAGTLSRIVDLRHGSDPASGVHHLATLRFFAQAPGTAELRLSRTDLASPSGAALTTSAYAGSVTVTP